MFAIIVDMSVTSRVLVFRLDFFWNSFQSDSRFPQTLARWESGRARPGKALAGRIDALLAEVYGDDWSVPYRQQGPVVT